MESKVSIPKPCNENWKSMLPEKKGRFCNSCNKTVIDFTKMTNPEIKKYFIDNSNNKSICGHFKLNQVEVTGNRKYDLLKNRLSGIRIKPIKAIAMFALSLVFTLSSCMGKRTVDGEPAVPINDTINESEISSKENKVDKVNDSIKNEINQIEKRK